MASPTWLPTDTLRAAHAAVFEDKAARDIWSLGFGQRAQADIDGLKAIAEPPPFEPAPVPAPTSLPIVVSDRPEIQQPAAFKPPGPAALRAPTPAPAEAPAPSAAPAPTATAEASAAPAAAAPPDPDLPNLPAARPSPQGPTEPIPGPTPQAGGTAPDATADPWGAKAYAAAVKAGHPNPSEFVEQMRWESGNFDPNVISGKRSSSAGAQGIAQIMPSTAAGWNVNPLDPDAALAAAARAMTGYYATYGGDSEKALAAYNMGPGNLQKYGPRGLPETDKYITIIHQRSGQASAPTAGSAPAIPPAPAAAPPQQPAAGAAPPAYKAMGGQQSDPNAPLELRPKPDQNIEPFDRSPYESGPYRPNRAIQGTVDESPKRPPDQGPAGPLDPEQDDPFYGEPIQYRQPLNGTSISDLPDDPRDADQGAHEGAISPNLPGQIGETPPEIQSTSSYNDVGAADIRAPQGTTDQGTQTTPVVLHTTPQAPPALLPIYDGNGQKVGYRQEEPAPTDPTIDNPAYTQPAGVRYDPNDPATAVNPNNLGALRPTDLPPELQGARPWLPATAPPARFTGENAVVDATVPRAAQTGPLPDQAPAPSRWSPEVQAQQQPFYEQAPFQDSQTAPAPRPTAPPRVISPYRPGAGNALAGVETPPSDQQILAGQGPVARAIDAGSRALPDQRPETLMTPENRRAFMQEAPASTPARLLDWRDRLTEGAADALARGLGQDPEQAIVNVQIDGVPIRMSASDLIQNVTDPLFIGGAGVGQVVLDGVGEAAIRAIAPYARGAIRATIGRLVESGPVQRGLEGARGLGSRIGEGIGEGRRTARALNAAEPSGTVLPGTLGVVTGNPLEASRAARGRVVPPAVADTLDFPIRVPDDPAVVRAIEAAGGSVDPEKGVTLNVIRYQGPEAHGGTATRGGAFYIADKPAAPSPYATNANNPKGVGGTERIEGLTRFRSPLILPGAPGEAAGFDPGMAQLGHTVHPDIAAAEREVRVARIEEEQLIESRNANIQKWKAAHPDAPTDGWLSSEDAPWFQEQIGRVTQATDDARMRVKTLTEQHPPPTSDAIDKAIREARRAGPEGSSQRAAALKDLVTRYGGDPALIDDLIRIRGADASESAWAIKENILAANARKQGYDGVVTVGKKVLGLDEIMADPELAALRQKTLDAVQEQQSALEALKGAEERRRIGAISGEDLIAAENRFMEADQTHKTLLAEYQDRKIIPNISELADVREGRNPTPGAPHAAEQARVRYEDFQQQAFDAQRRLGIEDPETKRLWGEAERAYAEYEQHGGSYGAPYNPSPPGYTLREDIPRRPETRASTTAQGTAGVAAQRGPTFAARALTDVSNSLGGGISGAAVGAGLPADTPEERRRNALVGAGVGMVAGPAAGRLMRRGEGGALATFGTGPNRPPGGTVQAPQQSANPNIRNVARMMSGQYQPVSKPRSLGERVVATLTDRYTIHANVPAEAGARIRAAGGAQPIERLAERVRENPNSIAAQRTRETLAPALQQLGDDADWGAQYLVHRHNLDIAKGKAQDAYDAAITAGRAPQQAQAIADRVRQSRVFSGGMTEQDITQALTDMQREIGPRRFKQVVDAADAFWRVGQENLDRKVAEGILTPADAQYLEAKYPHYVRTDIADYAEKGPASPSPGGKALGISSTGIKPISVQGTAKDRVNPILSTIDATYATENAITRNKAARDLVAVRDADPTTAGLFREVAPDAKAYRGNQQTMVPPDYTLRNGEQKLTQWDNGVARQFVIPREYAQLLTPTAGALLGDTAQPLRTFFGVLKAGLTTHSPVFQLALSPIRDVQDATVAMQTAAGAAARRPGASALENTVREGAAAVGALPQIAARYAQALPQVFSGFMSHEYGPRAAELLRAGAGFEGRPVGERGLRDTMRELGKSGGIEIKTPGDALRVLRSFATLGAERVGNRLEMLPRVAAANMEQARGGDTLSQSLAYKDATVDYLRGGWLTRQLSVPVMFLNPTVQSVAQTQRLYRKSPAAYTAALITSVAIPTLLAEAWNRGDPARAAAYDDRSDYLKNTGIVVEAPGIPEGTGKVGEALPTFVYIPLGIHAYAARIAREAAGLGERAAGLATAPSESTDVSDPRHWVRLGVDLLNMFSPLRGGDVTAVAGGMIPTPLQEAVELGTNKNLYTGSTIATDRTDENASTLSKGIAGGVNALTGAEWRPSQVEHVTGGTLGYPGRLVNAASDLATGRQRQETHPVQDTPVLGGLVRGFVRDTGGQQVQNAQDAMLNGDRLDVLREAGLRSDQVPPVPARYQGAPLSRDEQLAWQEAFNARFDHAVMVARHDPRWRSAATKAQALRDALATERENAALRALKHLTPSTIQRRIRAETDQKAS